LVYREARDHDASSFVLTSDEGVELAATLAAFDEKKRIADPAIKCTRHSASAGYQHFACLGDDAID